MWPSKRFCLALIGLIFYLLDVGSDNWVGYILIQNCHTRYGAAVLCLVWVLPSFFLFLWGIRDNNSCESLQEFLFALLMSVMIVPVTIYFLIRHLIKLDDDNTLQQVKK